MVTISAVYTHQSCGSSAWGFWDFLNPSQLSLFLAGPSVQSYVLSPDGWNMAWHMLSLMKVLHGQAIISYVSLLQEPDKK